jgi:chromate transporter
LFIKKHKKFLYHVLKYTISAFGGPQSHLALILKTFTISSNYYSKEEIIELNSLCQILPGATSTQLITLLGYKKGGFKLALLTFLIWIIPACFIMGLFSFFIVNNNTSLKIIKYLKFIQPMAIGFLLFSTYIIFKISIKNITTIFIFITGFLFTLIYFKTPWIIPILIVFASLFSNFLTKPVIKNAQPKRYNVNYKYLILFLSIFALSGYYSEKSRVNSWENRKIFNLFENFYRFGSIVFGGGDVLVPLLIDQYIERPTTHKQSINKSESIKLNKETILNGYGMVKAIPGPIFSISSFIGGISLSNKGKLMQVLGCIIAIIAIFTPGFLIILFVFPFWENLKLNNLIINSIQGINAVVVGIMLASATYLLKTDSIYLNFNTIVNLLIVFTTFILLIKTKTPPSLIVLLCIILGIIF